jgi:hypothetical protein
MSPGGTLLLLFYGQQGATPSLSSFRRTNPYISHAVRSGPNPRRSGVSQAVDTLKIGQGYTTPLTVTIRDDDGDALTGYYTGAESLELVITDTSATEVAFANSTVVWKVADDATVTLILHEDDTVDNPGRFLVTIGITKDGYRTEGYTATMVIEPRA